MKTKNLLFILIGISIILVGCQARNSVPTETTSTTGNVTINDEQANTVENTEKVNGETQTSTITTNLTLSDTTAYDSAIDLKDESFCEKISDDSYKSECQIEVKDQIVYDKALSNNDTNTCNQLSTVDKQNACKIMIEANKREKELFIEEQKERDIIMNSYNDILQEGDVSRCQEMEETMIASCEFNILVNAANHNQNPELCEKASSSETIARCKDSYKVEDVEPIE